MLDSTLNNNIVSIHNVAPPEAWISSFVPVLKPHRNEAPTIRWVTDFRALNAATRPMLVTLPSVEDNLLLLAGSKYFSSVDFSQGYFHLPVDENSLHYMFCAAPDYFIQYRFMSFGMRNAGSYFSLWVRNLHNKLPCHLRKHIVTYLDDLLIHTPTLDVHIQVLSELFSILEESGVILNSPKCDFIKQEIEYLGFSISFNEIKVKKSYLGKVQDWPVPQTLKHLESFLGFLSYYQSLIPFFSDRVFHLSELRRKVRNKQMQFIWTDQHEVEFKDLKKALLSSPCRGFPIYNFDDPKISPLILSTDFSSHGLSAILSQIQFGQEKLIACSARKTTSIEQSYSSCKGELRAVLFGINKFDRFLAMSNFFFLITDSMSLKFLVSMKTSSKLFMRWSTQIFSYNFKVLHRRGKIHLNCDILSREQSVLDEPTLQDTTDTAIHTLSGGKIPLYLH